MKDSADRDERLARSTSAETGQRVDRAMQDRAATEDRELTDSVRLEQFRGSFFQSALPDLPDIPGHHVCWLTTTNPRDSIVSRINLGYSLLKASDIPGFEYTAIKSGEYMGLISVNEMIAAKLPLNLYKLYMNEAHHVQPMAEEKKLSAVLEVIAEQARAKGARVELGDGSEALGKGPSRGVFEGVN